MDIDISLDATLGCGQAHRWVRKDGRWEGVLYGKVVTMEQRGGRIICEGTGDRRMISEYLRCGDDLDEIYAEISRDPFVRTLADACPGLRILKQDPWECIATYVIATNANVRRIGAMVENLCRTYGRNIGGRFSFPDAKDIASKTERLDGCRLGYRTERVAELAEKVADGVMVPGDLTGMGYEECSNELKKINGVGDKVADCISLFAYGHLNAFPVDARISRVMRDRYGIAGSCRRVSSFARRHFGRYAGYAQELLYHGNIILESQAQAGGSQPI